VEAKQKFASCMRCRPPRNSGKNRGADDRFPSSALVPQREEWLRYATIII
jgi:hypothetical protein